MADRVNFTDYFLKNLKPESLGKRDTIGDTQVPGLKVRFSAKGTKSFVVWRRFGGAPNPSARLIGRVGEIGLAEARQRAREWVALAKVGKDPAQVEADRLAGEARTRAEEAARTQATFGWATDRYFVHIASQRRAHGVGRLSTSAHQPCSIYFFRKIGKMHTGSKKSFAVRSNRAKIVPMP